MAPGRMCQTLVLVGTLAFLQPWRAACVAAPAAHPLLRLEAERAHCPGCSKVVAAAAVGGPSLPPQDQIVHAPQMVRFTVFSSGSGAFNASLVRQGPARGVVAAVSVNGHRAQDAGLCDEFVADGGVGSSDNGPDVIVTMARTWVPLALRPGINTVAFFFQNDGAAVDALEIYAAAAVAASDGGGQQLLPTLSHRGGSATAASSDFVEYEAEDSAVAQCAGPSATLIGPNYTAYSGVPHLATEASGRRACVLAAAGDAVEFTLGQPSNALELRCVTGVPACVPACAPACVRASRARCCCCVVCARWPPRRRCLAIAAAKRRCLLCCMRVRACSRE